MYTSQHGGTVVTGGAEQEGHRYQPMAISGCRPDMDIMKREIFGPVLPIISGLDEAISPANETEYGLTSSIYTTSPTSAMHAVKELSFGEIYVNRESFEAMQGFPAGVRKSGIGGAGGKHGVYAYTATRIACP